MNGDLNSYVDAFEQACQAGGKADVAQFTPPTDHPCYGEIVVELLRVDLECSWQSGLGSRLDDYRARFPKALDCPKMLKLVAFEEFRQRRMHGESIGREEYQKQFGVDVAEWPELPVGQSSPSDSADGWLRELSQESPESANRVAGALRQMPEVGEQFGEFLLIGELGQGALGRVYLAQQDDLSKRLVVLKVSPRLTDEPQHLAQLQHTNIVPVYSLHQRGSLQAICMPYLGAATLANLVKTCQRSQVIPHSGRALISTIAGEAAETVESIDGPGADDDAPIIERRQSLSVARLDVAQWESMSYVEAVTWLVARVAEGLAHAHDHGIVHCDLKPANILLSDDGQPIILDFHLAENRIGPLSAVSMVGGTLPYMAAEHISAMRLGHGVDHRCDVFSLGVVMYELLSGQLPYPLRKGSYREVADRMVADRRLPAANVRLANRSVPPGLAGIVARCLAPLPDDRYQSAHDLAEDLRRHLENRPLQHAPDHSVVERSRKWLKRHPRLSSGSTVMAVALVLLAVSIGGWWARGNQIAHRDALRAGQKLATTLEQVRAELNIPGVDRQIVANGVNRAEQALAGYGSLSDPDWQRTSPLSALDTTERQAQLTNLSDLLYLLAAGRAQLASLADGGRASRLYEQALAANRQARDIHPHPEAFPAIEMQKARLLTTLGQPASASGVRQMTRVEGVQSDASRRQLAWQHAVDGDFAGAATLYRQVIKNQSRDWTAWFSLGSCELANNNVSASEASFTTSIALAPHSYLGYFGRGLSALAAKKFPAAQTDFSRVLELSPGLFAARVNRAIACEGQGKWALAESDLSVALEAGAPQTRIYFLRARIRDQLGNKKGAAADREMGLALPPQDALSWVARGVARLATEPQQAERDFREALRINPQSREALQDLAHVLSERLGRPAEAVPVLSRLAKLSPGDPGPIASRGVLQARQGQRLEAVSDAQQALSMSPQPLIVYQVAGIYALCSMQEPGDQRHALKLLATALKKDVALVNLAQADPDLRPLSGSPTFQRLVRMARNWIQFPVEPSTD